MVAADTGAADTERHKDFGRALGCDTTGRVAAVSTKAAAAAAATSGLSDDPLFILQLLARRLEARLWERLWSGSGAALERI